MQRELERRKKFLKGRWGTGRRVRGECIQYASEDAAAGNLTEAAAILIYPPLYETLPTFAQYRCEWG